MTSERKIRANRQNANASTGPKTAKGRARAARNALRHGLNLPAQLDPLLSKEAEVLAHNIAGETDDPAILDLARQIADTQIELSRARRARHELLFRIMRDHFEPFSLSSLVSAGQRLTPEEQKQAVRSVSRQLWRLLAVDRYEQRAFSRRRFDIRAFDDASLYEKEISCG